MKFMTWVNPNHPTYTSYQLVFSRFALAVAWIPYPFVEYGSGIEKYFHIGWIAPSLLTWNVRFLWLSFGIRFR